MLQTMNMTSVLAILLGLYFLSAGIGLLVDRAAFQKTFSSLTEHPTLGYLGGIIAFAIGAAMVAAHNNWDGLLASIVTLIGWFALAEGILMLAARRWFLGLFENLVLSVNLMKFFGTGTIVFGAILIAAGLMS